MEQYSLWGWGVWAVHLILIIVLLADAERRKLEGGEFSRFCPPPPFGEKAFKKNIYLNLRSALYNS